MQPPQLREVRGEQEGAATVGMDPPAMSIPVSAAGMQRGCSADAAGLQRGCGLPHGAGARVHLAGGEAKSRVPIGCPSPELAPRALLTHRGAEPRTAEAGREDEPVQAWAHLVSPPKALLPHPFLLSPRPAHPSRSGVSQRAAAARGGRGEQDAAPFPFGLCF